jgi:hypothetical protein
VGNVIADLLVSKLEGVRRTGDGRWIARCPAHEDRSPSLSVRELGDRALIHCFAGCHPGEVVAAVGLELSDLFPPRVDDDKRPRRERRPFDPGDALRLIEHELFFVIASARKLAEGLALGPDEHARLLEVVARIASARMACGQEPA